MKRISNVLTGVATLYVREGDSLAEWTTEHSYVGDHSVRLYKAGKGNDGSAHIEIDPSAREITFGAFFTATLINNSFWHRSTNLDDAAVVASYGQFEFRFEDPDPGSAGWVEITAVPLQTHPGASIWVENVLTAAATPSGRSGVNEIGTSMFDWTLAMLDSQEGTINGLCVDTADNWILTRVRVELWEATPERETFIDRIEIMGTVYSIEPGAATPGMALSSPYMEVGYTEDGVTMEYAAETTDIEVEEETFPIDRALTKETVTITCNMAESSLYNMDKAMAGAVLSGSILKLGGGVNKKANIMVVGTSPEGFSRQIFLPSVTAMGNVGMAFKKGEKTVVPVTFGVLKTANTPAVSVVDNSE